MEFGMWRKNSARGFYRWGRRLLYSRSPFTFLLIVEENVAERTGAARLGLAPCNHLDARIFASRGVGRMRASLRVRLWARSSLGVRREEWRTHVLDACK